MRIAYIISAYRLPDQLVRLVRSLQAPGASFYIHVDRKSPAEYLRRVRSGLSGCRNVVLLPRHRSYWGGFGHVRASLKGIAAALEGPPFDYAALLTGQDYPIKPNAAIAEFLERRGGTSFLQFTPLPSPDFPGETDRFTRWHFPTFRASFPNARLPLPVRRSFPAGMTPYRGSGYWVLPEACVRYVHRFVREHPSYVRFFRTVNIPDELFFHSIVMNSEHRSTVVSDDLHFVDWSGGGSSPGVLTAAHLPALAASPQLFARKFDETVDARVLDLVDAELRGAPSLAGRPPGGGP